MRRRLLRKNHNRNKILMILFLVFLVVIGIGYSNVSSNLMINGTIRNWIINNSGNPSLNTSNVLIRT